MTPEDLLLKLRLIVVTDSGLAAPRSVESIVAAALAGGARAIQLRNKGEPASELLALGRDLRSLTRESGALLFVNDRLDLALALEADGIHLGPDDLPVAAARRAAGERLLIGRSCDDPAVARIAVADGADYLGCGTVYATRTKVDAGEVIGLAGLARVVDAVQVPVVGIGGIHTAVAEGVARTGAAGLAVVGAVMSAADAEAAARDLIASFERGRA